MKTKVRRLERLEGVSGEGVPSYIVFPEVGEPYVRMSNGEVKSPGEVSGKAKGYYLVSPEDWEEGVL